MTLYFSISAIETFLLTFYLVLIGSEPGEAVIFHLSPTRLVLAAIIFCVGSYFSYLAILSFRKARAGQEMFSNVLTNWKKLWLILILSLLGAGLLTFSLTQPIDAYGNFKLIFERLEPMIVWGILLATQTAEFLLIWLSAYHVNNKGEVDIQKLKKELLPVFGLFFAVVIFKLLFVTAGSYGPTGRGDEMTYFDMADSFYRGFFDSAQTHHYPPLYPLTIIPALVFRRWTFDVIKMINVLLSSSIVFPIYLTSRLFLGKKTSLAVTFLSCLIPYHLVFPRRIVSENLFFPLFLWAMYLTYTQPKGKKQRLIWDTLNGALIGMMYLSRYITLATIPFFMAAWWVKPFGSQDKLLKPSKQKVLHFIVFCAAIVLIFAPWILDGMQKDVPAKLMLGFGVASKTTTGQLTIANLLKWVLLYVFYFVLIAAPVFPLLLLSFKTVDWKQWRVGFGRWIFTVLALMGGFFAAVVRHSWRAFYNRDVPSAIMGRYLIFYSVPFFVISFTVLKKLIKENKKPKKTLIYSVFGIALILVFLSYQALVLGTIIPTDGSLLKSHGSVDVFFIDVLGWFFFVILATVYLISIAALNNTKRTNLKYLFILSLIVYYVSGLPAYTQDLLDYQTYPWLASKIASLAYKNTPIRATIEPVTVFYPAGTDLQYQAEIYNGLRVRALDNTILAEFSQSAVKNMQTTLGFVVDEAPFNIQLETAMKFRYSFNDVDFIVGLIEN